MTHSFRPRTALFLGGPEAGNVHMVRGADRTIVIPEFNSALLSYGAEPSDEPVESVIKKHFYTEQKFSFFGAPLSAWVLEGLGEREAAAQLGAAILNQLGLDLLREGRR